MTTGEVSRLPAAVEPPAPEQLVDDVLSRLQEGAVRLLGGLDRPPTSLRLRAAGVEIELEWPDPRPPAPVAAPVPATTPVVAAEGPAPSSSTPAAQPESTARHVTAHMVGTFYRAPQPGARPFVEPGDEIRPGQQVGVIEAMKLSIPVEADAAGRVLEVLIDNAAPVEFGDKLLSYEPS